MKLTRICTSLAGLALVASLFAVTAAGTSAATATGSVSNVLKSQRLDHAKLVGHSSFKPSATNLKQESPERRAATFTDDLNLVRKLTGAAGQDDSQLDQLAAGSRQGARPYGIIGRKR